MNKSKKVFAGLAAVFALLLAYASYDIATRTSFPKRRNHENSSIDSLKRDSTRVDSVINYEKK